MEIDLTALSDLFREKLLIEDKIRAFLANPIEEEELVEKPGKPCSVAVKHRSKLVKKACCGSRGPRHKKTCNGKLPPGDDDIPAYQCLSDGCERKFTSWRDPNIEGDVRCPGCGSDQIKPQ